MLYTGTAITHVFTLHSQRASVEKKKKRITT